MQATSLTDQERSICWTILNRFRTEHMENAGKLWKDMELETTKRHVIVVRWNR